MSTTVATYTAQAYVPAKSIARVLAALIERDVEEFVVLDDRGGSGTWVIRANVALPAMRGIVGGGIDVEEI